jgi:DnaJ domain
VNHYERLKVSQDAPAEVIRAAYRALAGKLHPDRQGADTGPDDSMHTQMAGLNAAYEVLIDPKLRQDYDATLAPASAGALAASRVDAGADSRQGPSTRVDLDWLSPKATKSQGLRSRSQPMMVLGASLAAGVLLGLGWFVWQVMGQHQMERALSDQYAAHPPGVAPLAADVPVPEDLPPPIVDTSTALHHKPTVDELSHMSDEELIKVLPTLDQPEPAAPERKHANDRVGAQHHLLDGSPLNLRTDRQLIDPLAPDRTPTAKRP